LRKTQSYYDALWWGRQLRVAEAHQKAKQAREMTINKATLYVCSVIIVVCLVRIVVAII